MLGGGPPVILRAQVASSRLIRCEVIKDDGRSYRENVATFTELGMLMERHGVRWCYVDAQPEAREARAFQLAHPKRVVLVRRAG